ncbi:hypothetical protein EET67_05135 [Pseudaminobacter arsenicus]|uniref:Uncharacterized protein n=1 Tax=Borborobacter arsenicus TaxID=1851146 RepID=A0A432VA49_9HYPH|nr:hypothetical protein [Pseudaminobacter arsenicus]RUM99024.1 hypothetical protein EET67_05135 [Pseudaminobacter arsenicus]
MKSELICAGDGGVFKECTKCLCVKPISDFSPLKTVVSGLRPWCKQCARNASLSHHYENRDSLLEKARARYAKNPQPHRDRALKWHYENHEASIARGKQWKLENPDRVSEYNKAYYKENKEALLESYAEWAAENATHKLEYNRGWYQQNPTKHAEYGRRRRECVRFRIESSIRCRIWTGITKGSKAQRSTFSLLGYTIDELKDHLGRQFLPGMTWENYGEWHIDHIRPLSSFSYDTPDDADFKDAWSLTNLQPLWKTDNLKKGAKWVPDNDNEDNEAGEA